MKLVILISIFALSGPPAAPRAETAAAQPIGQMPNAMTQSPSCLPIVQQVQDEARRDRSAEHRTLDQDPPAHLLRAVDRHVDGCREVTLIRRNAAPAADTFDTAPARRR